MTSGCRSRIREAITNGAGCLHNSHRPQRLISDSAFWVEEGQTLRRWVTEGGSDDERKGVETPDW